MQRYPYWVYGNPVVEKFFPIPFTLGVLNPWPVDLIPSALSSCLWGTPWTTVLRTESGIQGSTRSDPGVQGQAEVVWGSGA